VSGRRRSGEVEREAIDRRTVAIMVAGKSTLVNRLTESRTPSSRDAGRHARPWYSQWTGMVRLIDTGGVDAEAGGPYGAKIADQAKVAVEDADLVLFVVDARAGITPGDEELAVILRASKKPVIVLANKIDDPRRDTEAAVFHRLGLGDPWPLSGLHGHGTGDLLDEIVSRLPGTGEVAVGDEAIRVAILGRPNVGKSSLRTGLSVVSA
jgi:GTP-binding protein